MPNFSPASSARDADLVNLRAMGPHPAVQLGARNRQGGCHFDTVAQRAFRLLTVTGQC